MPAIPDIPEPVLRKATALGAAGLDWIEALPDRIAELEDEWSITVGSALAGGSSGCVVNARTKAGVDVVLKLAMPDGLAGNGEFSRELDALLLERQSFVTVLRFDRARRAMLLERLGRPLGDLGLTVPAQIEVLVETLIPVWRTVCGASRLRTGAEQARELRGFIRAGWNDLGQPCASRTRDCAERYARRRQAAFDPSSAVLIHGDAHPANVLEAVPGSMQTFKLIDPDAMLSEPAHDLAIALRDWSDELLASDPVESGRAWASALGARASVDPQAIWEWAFVERVSTGLFLLQLGDERGRRLLEVADHWSGAAV